MPPPAIANLTPMQRAYVRAYPEADSQTAAARIAGYSAPAQRARELMDLPHVIAAIAEELQVRERRAAITVDRIILALWDTYEDSREHGDRGPAIRALELIGRHIGMFPRPEIQIDARQQVLQLPEGLSLEELRALAARPVELPGGDTPDTPYDE